jgi:hypothetical protein
MKTGRLFVTGSVALAGMLAAQAAGQEMGRIVVANDEWTLGPPGYVQPSDGLAFALRVGAWFTGGQTGSFFAWNHYAFNDGELAFAMEGAGHTWTVGSTSEVTLAFLQQYDGVFLAAVSVDAQVLIDYVEGGGNVYIAAGTGAWINPIWEAGAWNPFLEHFGLKLHNTWNTAGATHLPVVEAHPIFAGVDHLWHDVGQGIFDLQSENPANRVFLPVPGAPEQGHYAVYDASGCYPDCNSDGVLTVSDFGCFQTKFVAGDTYADCNESGSLSVADFGCFQTRFVAGDPYADCNADGVLTVADFGCFQTKFVAGCP